jgi:hypothetical protein
MSFPNSKSGFGEDEILQLSVSDAHGTQKVRPAVLVNFDQWSRASLCKRVGNHSMSTSLQ